MYGHISFRMIEAASIFENIVRLHEHPRPRSHSMVGVMARLSPAVSHSGAPKLGVTQDIRDVLSNIP